jgi:transposase
VADENEPGAADLRAALYEKYVYPYCDKRPETRDDHLLAVLRVLVNLREEWRAELVQYLNLLPEVDPHEVVEVEQIALDSVMSAAAPLWALLASEVGECPQEGKIGHYEIRRWRESRARRAGVSRPFPRKLPDRDFLTGLLERQSITPAYSPAIETVALLMPRWLSEKLLNALDALDSGEVLPLVAPALKGKHGQGWTLDQMRARGLEHVAFLEGQRMTKDKARQRVCVAMGIGYETLRSWEKKGSALRADIRDLDGRLQRAKGAGVIEMNGRSDSDDEYDVAAWLAFTAETLEAFGQRFRVLLGPRSHSTATRKHR